jgi:ATP:corrinoid adenosyltransferase
MNYGFVPVEEVVATLKERPPHVNVVVTGRNAPEALLGVADLITDMQAVKHPFTEGRKALMGIDY